MAKLDDTFRLGEGFDGFPKRLPDDCVEYTLCLVDPTPKSPREHLSRLEAIRKESSVLSTALLKDYIWQRERFKLDLERKDGSMYLHGLTNYGDSIEDEWLIVYILRELSFKFPDLWIKVVDTDGEFLLIEAANAVPSWLNPEIADNRVWIHGGKIHIIPVDIASMSSSGTEATAPPSRPLSFEEAQQIITSNSQALINSPQIEEEAFYRLQRYPMQITSSLHHALVKIPRKLAYVLHVRPALIAPATEAFYLRDPISLKYLNAGLSDLVFAPNDLVVVSARFTKVLFAQLKSQQITPPPTWRRILGDAEKSIAGNVNSRRVYTQLELGMKITLGFEMLAKDNKSRDNRVLRELEIILEDLVSGGGSDLPSDQEILEWTDATREDDESWMDINFQDFELELQGKSGATKSNMQETLGSKGATGFGDPKTQADLKKMVERFESFLNDETAGPEGVNLDDVDIDDDDEDEDKIYGSEDSQGEDTDFNFDENRFANLMQELVGASSADSVGGLRAADTTPYTSQVVLKDESSDDMEGGIDEASEMRRVMREMDAELNEAGALSLDSLPDKLIASEDKAKQAGVGAECSDDEVDIDFNLAKNLLESFKSQAGMAGPGGNLLGMMGLQMPRDEDDLASTGKKT